VVAPSTAPFAARLGSTWRASSSRPRVAVDTTGGDFAPRNVVDGALEAVRYAEVGVALVGAPGLLITELERHPDAGSLDVGVVAAPEAVAMDEPPTAVLRRKPAVAVRVAAELVADGEAGGFFSAGNIGAMVLAAHTALGRLPGDCED